PLLLLFLNDPPPPRLPALSLHDALPISPLEDCEHCERAGESRPPRGRRARRGAALARGPAADPRRAVADGGVLSLGVLRHGHHQRVRAATPHPDAGVLGRAGAHRADRGGVADLPPVRLRGHRRGAELHARGRGVRRPPARSDRLRGRCDPASRTQAAPPLITAVAPVGRPDADTARAERPRRVDGAASPEVPVALWSSGTWRRTTLP